MLFYLQVFFLLRVVDCTATKIDRLDGVIRVPKKVRYSIFNNIFPIRDWV